MRLPIIISAGLLLSFGLNLPVMSKSRIEIAQSPANNNWNLRRAEKRLEFNRRFWNQQNISNYSYEFSNSCFCIGDARGPVVIKVRNGVTTSITSVATGEPVRELQEINYSILWGGHLARPVPMAGETPTPQ